MIKGTANPQVEHSYQLTRKGTTLLYFPDTLPISSQAVMRDSDILNSAFHERKQQAESRGVNYKLSLPLAQDVAELAKCSEYSSARGTRNDPLKLLLRSDHLMTNNAVLYIKEGVVVIDRPTADHRGLKLPKDYSIEAILHSKMEEIFRSSQGRVLVPEGFSGVRFVEGHGFKIGLQYKEEFVDNPLVVALFNDRDGLIAIATNAIDSGTFYSLALVAHRSGGKFGYQRGRFYPVVINRSVMTLQTNVIGDFLGMHPIPLSLIRLDKHPRLSDSADIGYEPETVKVAINYLMRPDIAPHISREQIRGLESLVGLHSEK